VQAFSFTRLGRSLLNEWFESAQGGIPRFNSKWLESSLNYRAKCVNVQLGGFPFVRPETKIYVKFKP
jgi:hypothetical protein